MREAYVGAKEGVREAWERCVEGGRATVMSKQTLGKPYSNQTACLQDSITHFKGRPTAIEGGQATSPTSSVPSSKLVYLARLVRYNGLKIHMEPWR